MATRKRTLTEKEVNEVRPYRLQYTFKEAAYMLCVRDSETVKKWCKDWEIPYHQIGNSREKFILHDDLVKLIDKAKSYEDFQREIYGNR